MLALLTATALLSACGTPPEPGAAPPAAGTDSSAGATSATTSPGPTPSPTPTADACEVAAADLSLPEQVGQLIMVGVTGELDSAEESAIREHHFGSVILMGNDSSGTAGVKSRIEAIRGAGGEVLIAVDQEGGQVQRLTGTGFDRIPSAAAQAEQGTEALTRNAETWGTQLREAGVHLTLAPVADVVPPEKATSNEPIGALDRGYGNTPEEVSENVVAFVTGMNRAGLGTSMKHFPNLGEVVGNTDFTSVVRDDVTTADSPALAPYRAGIEGGASTVMVGTAIYTRIDDSAPAAFSPKVVGILREDMGFDGVVISDDLGVAKAATDVPAGERGVRFVRAGGDLAISVDADVASAMATGLVEAAQSDPELRRQVQRSAERVLTLKRQLQAGSC